MVSKTWLQVLSWGSSETLESVQVRPGPAKSASRPLGRQLVRLDTSFVFLRLHRLSQPVPFCPGAGQVLRFHMAADQATASETDDLFIFFEFDRFVREKKGVL